MKMALVGTTLMIKEADQVQFSVIKSWSKMRWDPRKVQKAVQASAGIHPRGKGRRQ